MNLPRCSGILLHVTSLPSPYGIGDFGDAAYTFVDHLAEAGVSIWQILPLGPIGYGNSPYQAFSAFAGEPLLISLEKLAHAKLLEKSDLKHEPRTQADIVDYDAVRALKTPLLHKAFERFKRHHTPDDERAFAQFSADQASWLDDYAIFQALRGHFGPDKSWTDWEPDLRRRAPAALAHMREKLARDIELQKFLQWIFYKQWGELRAHAQSRGIRIMGDIPIYVSHNSADVWAQPNQFELDENGNPKVVAGVPPDYFSEDGQRWGNPIYDWQEMERSGFRWWIDRFRGTFRLYDALRLDHFRGFEAYWECPANENTAKNGRWVTAPGAKLFEAVQKELGDLNIIAENLGDITPAVEELRRQFGFPGMAVLQFAFGIEGNAANYRPHNLEHEVIAYTGTHDNDTVVGWWNSGGGDSTRTEEDIRKEKDFTLRYLGPGEEPIEWKMMRALFGSVARVAIVPMQDVLGLGSEARMNRPGVAEQNWSWRMIAGAFTGTLRSKLHSLLEVFDRIPTASPAEESSPTRER